MKDRIIREAERILPELIDDIKDICSYDSRKDKPEDNHPYGKRITLCLEEALKKAERLGFKTLNVENRVGIAMNEVGSEDYIACVGHLDVVDINGTWKTDPFVCSEINGRLFARGVLDNKGPIFSCLYALKVLKNLNYDFPIDVQIIFGTDEESGMDDMKWYFKDHKYPLMGFTPDCKYPVVYAERGRAQFVYRISKDYFAEYLSFMNEYILNQNDLAVSLGVDYADEEFGKNQVRKIELLDDNDDLLISLVSSYPASYSLEQMKESLSKNCSEHMRLELVSNLDPVFFEKDSYLIKKLEEAYEEIMDDDGKAVTTTGGTYAKVVKNIVPFGPSFKGQKGIGHLPNEWMDIEDIKKNTQIYAYALYKLMEGLKDA